MSSLRSRSARQLHGDDVQAVVQVLAELPLVHHVAQVDVGRRDDADVHLDRFDAAEPHELPLLDHAQELGLRLERDVADLVEEDRALVGQLEEPLFRVDRPGERPFHVAEEVRLEEVGRQVARVHRDERPIGPRGILVERPRDELLAGAALAVDQNRRPAGRRLDDQVEHLAHARAAADDLAEPVGARLQVLAERAVLGDEPALRQGVAQHDEHFVVLERLGDVVVRPALHRRNGVLDRGERRDHQHRQVVVDFLELVERRDAVHARHHHVHDRRVERDRPDELEPLGGVRRHADLIPLVGEERLEDLAHDFLVVDDEDRPPAGVTGRGELGRGRARHDQACLFAACDAAADRE